MTESSSWSELLDEYRDTVIGPSWFAEITRAVAAVCPGYPPSIYANSSSWSATERDDLVQDVISSQLLAARQLTYITDVATDIDAGRALLSHVVKRTLARRRTRTVIDNLLDRCRQLNPSIARPPRTTTGAANESQIRQAAAYVSRLPRVPIRGGDRAPQVFTTETLRQILEAVTEPLGPDFGQRDLAKTFEMSLTDVLPSALVIYDGTFDQPDTVMGPEEAAVVSDTLIRTLTSLTTHQKQVMGLKLKSWSDDDIGKLIGRSRPTVAAIRENASKQIRAEAGSLPSTLQDQFVTGLVERLLIEVAEHSEKDVHPNV